MSLSRPLRFTLLASLLLNVMLVTAGGLWWLGQREPAPVATGTGPSQSDEDRERFRRAMAPHREQMRQRRDAVRSARADVGAALREPSFDPGRLSSALAELRAAESAAAEDSHRLLVDYAGTLDDGGRERMVTRMQQRHEGRGGRDRGRERTR